MDRIEEFATPIRRVLHAHPAYTLVGLSLGYSLFRWNSNRVGDALRHLLTVLKITSRSRFPHQRSALAQMHERHSRPWLQKVDLVLASKYSPLTLIADPIFKVPTINHWLVVVSGKYTDELQRAPEDVLSFNEAANEVDISYLYF